MGRKRPVDLPVVQPTNFALRVNLETAKALGLSIPESFYSLREFVDVGGLMSYGPDFSDLWRRAADIADRILRGAKPADIPVEQPTKFDLVINRKTAKTLGLTVPQTLLATANDLIE
jgi:putative tryptophan/tyrosine transport system substrate-binding protein